MAIVSLNTPGQFGLSIDLSPAELPENAWSAANNTRFSNGALQTMRGDQVIVDGTPEQITYGIPVTAAPTVGAFWLVAGVTHAYAMEGNYLTDVTPIAATGGPPSEENCWSGANLGQRVVLNDTYRAPWWWPEPSAGTKMIDLPNWPANTLCKTMRSFKSYLIALDVTKSGVNYPTMVKWSHPALPGQPPASWDPADETKDAGEYSLMETSGIVIDCVGMRDTNVIYKSDSVWGMQFIGGVFIFRFTKIFGDWGIPHRNCAVEYMSGRHFCFTGTDIVAHDGNTVRSVVRSKVKGMLRGITDDQIRTCYVANNPAFDEVWFCWRRAGGGGFGADTAIVWNHLDDTITVRTLTDIRWIGTGRVDSLPPDSTAWDPTIPKWDDFTSVWAEYNLIPAFYRLMGFGTGNITWIDGIDLPLLPALCERAYFGVPVRAGKPPDLSAMKFVRRIWPRFVTTVAGTRVILTFGTSDSVGETITWRAPMTYIIGTTRKLDLTLSGKVFAMRIESDPSANNGLWRFNGMDVDLEVAGEM